MNSDNLILGLLIIMILFVTVLWIILMEPFLNFLFVSNRFWGTVYPGFGVIGIFLGIIVILIGVGINIKYKKRIQV
ncbi:hypothetical protein AC481_06235 [miscellaneous Crenarchaeota group archaeon SMTZ-80]|nr:MAG: hypothetical protein AC481_06235 [miscellaneous Crenarchaeota group archaeon SMTZ-80]